MGDLPDWTTSVQGVALEATSFRSGLDADKPAVPAVGEIYYGRDTKVLWICAVAGSWTGFDASILVEGIITLYADLDGGGYEIKNIADPTAAQSAATRAYVLARLASYLALAGGTMSGAIAMGSNKITGLAAPSASTDAARKNEVDTVDAKLDDVTPSAPSRVLDTIYQNTSGKIIMVAVSVSFTGGATGGATAQIKSTSPPTTSVAGAFAGSGVPDTTRSALTFIVPPNWYYRVATSGTVTLSYWEEWTLL